MSLFVGLVTQKQLMGGFLERRNAPLQNLKICGSSSLFPFHAPVVPRLLVNLSCWRGVYDLKSIEGVNEVDKLPIFSLGVFIKPLHSKYGEKCFFDLHINHIRPYNMKTPCSLPSKNIMAKNAK